MSFTPKQREEQTIQVHTYCTALWRLMEGGETDEGRTENDALKTIVYRKWLHKYMYMYSTAKIQGIMRVRLTCN